MPPWLSSPSRRGDPEASTSLGRPIMSVLSWPHPCPARGAAPKARLRASSTRGVMHRRRGPHRAGAMGCPGGTVQNSEFRTVPGLPRTTPLCFVLRCAGTRSADSLEPIDDTAFGEVVRTHLDQHLVAGQHADAVLAHAAGRVGDDFMAVLKLDAEVGVGEELRHKARKFQLFFLRHSTPSVTDVALIARAFVSFEKSARNLAELGNRHNCIARRPCEDWLLVGA